MKPGPGTTVVMVFEWGLITTAALIIGARLRLRLKIQRRSLWISDILMVLAWLCSIASAACDTYFAHMGALEPHIDTALTRWEGSPGDMIVMLKAIKHLRLPLKSGTAHESLIFWAKQQIFWASTFPFYMTFYFCEAALLATLFQLIPPFMKKRRMILRAVTGYCVAAFIVSICYHLFGCFPPWLYWSIEGATCPRLFGRTSFEIGWALHFTGDVLIFYVPWLFLHALQLRRAMKVGICCTFLLGVINIVFCLARFVEVERAVSPTGLSLSTVTLWSALDCTICVVIACLPSLRPYLRSRSQANTYADQYNYRASGKRRSTTVPTNATSATRAGGGPSTLRRGSAGFELIDDEGAPESSPKTMNVLRMTTIRVQSGTASGAGSRASSGSQNDRHLEGGDDGQKSDIELVHVVGK
ncbi:hypothetical protein RB597_010288 [Gaeumannomyces tritici]